MSEADILEAFALLDLVSAEFRSDPTNVQCFDLRIVERVTKLSEKWNEGGRLL